MRSLNGLILAMVLTCVFPGMLIAQYVVSPSVTAGGGARMTGGGYAITGTTGQSSPVGISSGAGHSTQHGFWHAAMGSSALGPMVLAIHLLNPTSARLSWAAVTGATLYELYRSTTPYFAATGAAWQTVAAPTTQQDFAAGIGDQATNYFFKGIARNATQTSPESNTVGEIDFDAEISTMFRTPPAVSTER
ncbi:hypothetical protein JXA88_07620 [Candidatus Fermentibacteria bacterium]|nr:hypothetical protein [Candidatus Fermentibacteria bacterium]